PSPAGSSPTSAVDDRLTLSAVDDIEEFWTQHYSGLSFTAKINVSVHVVDGTTRLTRASALFGSGVTADHPTVASFWWLVTPLMIVRTVFWYMPMSVRGA
ncbi:MAG: hypothetical protein ABI307_12850, partial [Mycobacterium sp.]